MNRATYRRWRLVKFVALDVLFWLAMFACGFGIGLIFARIHHTYL